eukprot:3303114-Pleurochrysis_carterae.AAC.1
MISAFESQLRAQADAGAAIGAAAMDQDLSITNAMRLGFGWLPPYKPWRLSSPSSTTFVSVAIETIVGSPAVSAFSFLVSVSVRVYSVSFYSQLVLLASAIEDIFNRNSLCGKSLIQLRQAAREQSFAAHQYDVQLRYDVSMIARTNVREDEARHANHFNRPSDVDAGTARQKAPVLTSTRKQDRKYSKRPVSIKLDSCVSVTETAVLRSSQYEGDMAPRPSATRNEPYESKVYRCSSHKSNILRLE